MNFQIKLRDTYVNECRRYALVVSTYFRHYVQLFNLRIDDQPFLPPRPLDPLHRERGSRGRGGVICEADAENAVLGAFTADPHVPTSIGCCGNEMPLVSTRQP
ncbi:unnamed protein product [Ixodes pacificus]